MTRRREENMRKWLGIFFVLLLLSVFSFGCTMVSKEAKVKCPKCGAVFTINEGLDALERGGGKQ
jgi:hypothetical protein